MQHRILLPTATWLALLAPHARAQTASPQQPGKAPPFATAPSLMHEPPMFRDVGPAPHTLTWGPGPIGYTLAWTGQKLQWFGRRHTWTIGHSVTTPIFTPIPAGPVGYFPRAYYGPSAYGQPTDFFGPPPPTPRPTPQRMTARGDEEAPPAPAAPAAVPVMLPRLAVPPPTDNIAVVPWDH